MAASKEGIVRARRVIEYNKDALGLHAVRKKPSSYFVNAFAPNMKPRKTDRPPNSLQGCRIKLDRDGFF